MKRYGADTELAQFVRLDWDRCRSAKVKIAKAMDRSPWRLRQRGDQWTSNLKP